MTQIILVGVGGFIGSVLRYEISAFAFHLNETAKFPFGTVAVNLIGCFLIGLLGGIGERAEWLNSDVRLLLITGLLGGFTTFSAFGLETFYLLRTNEYQMAALNVVLSVICGLFAVGLGFRMSALSA